MRLDPYLNFDGDCADAFRFYHQCLGGELEVMTHAESPMADQTPPESRDRVMNASLRIGKALIMGSDAPLGGFRESGGTHVSILVHELAEAERIFTTLSDGGRVTMPFGKTFWADGFGMLVDRYGIPWMVNCAADEF